MLGALHTLPSSSCRGLGVLLGAFGSSFIAKGQNKKGPKWSQNSPHNGSNIVLKWSQSGPKMVPKYRELRYGRLDTLNIKIRPLFQEIKAEQGACNNSGKEERNGGGTEQNRTEEYSCLR